MLERGLIVAAVLFLGSVCFVFRDSLPFQERRPTMAAGTASNVQPAAAPAVKSKPKASRLRSGHANDRGADASGTTGDREDTAASQIAERYPVTVYDVAVPVLLPRSADFPTGMSRADITTKFGRPDLSATWKDVGHLREKFIYTGASQVTAVMIQDGRVVSSRTEARSFQPRLTPEP